MGNATFEEEFDAMAASVHKLARSKGLRIEISARPALLDIVGLMQQLREEEVSADLKRNVETPHPVYREAQHLTDFTEAEHLLAEVVIRCMEIAGARDWSLGGAIRAATAHTRSQKAAKRGLFG